GRLHGLAEAAPQPVCGGGPQLAEGRPRGEHLVAGPGEDDHGHAVVDLEELGLERPEERARKGVSPLGFVDPQPQDAGPRPLHKGVCRHAYSMMATVWPSWTTSPSLTRSSLIVPATGATI